MFKENKYQNTELEALQLERKEQDWQKNYGSKTDDYIAKIDQLLAEGTNEKRMQIKEMFMNQEFFEHYKQVDLFAIIYIVMIIYKIFTCLSIYVAKKDTARLLEKKYNHKRK